VQSRFCLWGWAPKIIETFMFMFGQAQSAVDMASRLLRYGYFYRVDYTVPPKPFRMDNSACANDLVAIGRRIYKYVAAVGDTWRPTRGMW